MGTCQCTHAGATVAGKSHASHSTFVCMYACMYANMDVGMDVCIIITYSTLGINRYGWQSCYDRGQLNMEKCVLVRAREIGLARQLRPSRPAPARSFSTPKLNSVQLHISKKTVASCKISGNLMDGVEKPSAFAVRPGVPTSFKWYTDKGSNLLSKRGYGLSTPGAVFSHIFRRLASRTPLLPKNCVKSMFFFQPPAIFLKETSIKRF